jgi:dTDP-4-dehydrorhamnose 3,5-epimerase
MKFTETELSGVYIIELEKIEDERGFFARAWCAREFSANELVSDFVQCNISCNTKKGTLRGLHYQCRPYEEVKTVRCTKGAIFDVVVDIRPNSPTFCKWISVTLSDDNYKMLYIPGGFAHGFQTLCNDTDVFYQMSEYYYPEYSRGVRWNDPAFGIKWPLPCSCISQKDKSYNDFIIRERCKYE